MRSIRSWSQSTRGRYRSLISNPIYAAVRTLLAVCGTYIGKNEYDAIVSAPGLSSAWFQVIYWIIQLMAIYTSVSAVLSVIGRDLVRSLRLGLAKKGDLVIIYGCNDNAIMFGRECRDKAGKSVVFVMRRSDPGAEAQIDSIHAAYRTDEAAVHPGEAFVRSLHIRSGRKVSVYCIDNDLNSNEEYAGELKEALAECNIDPRYISLVMRGSEKTVIRKRATGAGTYELGSETVFDKYSLAARLLIRTCRPWEEIHFDEECRATEDFSVLMLGFGQYNQRILKELICNGQFCGSTFHATVISSDCSRAAGSMRNECRSMFDAYDIQLIEQDAGSIETFDYIEKNSDRFSFISVSIGNEQHSLEIAGQIVALLERMGSSIPVVCTSDEGIRVQRSGESGQIIIPLYTLDTMDFQKSDMLAMQVNNTYSDDPSTTAWEEWKKCGYYGRMSSRASADFIPAILYSMHITENDATAISNGAFTVSADGTSDVKAGILSARQAENLGRTEHERWCAFQYSMGFSPMSWDEWNERADIYRQQLSNGEKQMIRPGVNMEKHRHICLMPWEDLNNLSVREHELTGRQIDYQQIDINNVLAIPGVLSGNKSHM